jgi:hypothetical protein
VVWLGPEIPDKECRERRFHLGGEAND